MDGPLADEDSHPLAQGKHIGIGIVAERAAAACARRSDNLAKININHLMIKGLVSHRIIMTSPVLSWSLIWSSGTRSSDVVHKHGHTPHPQHIDQRAPMFAE